MDTDTLKEQLNDFLKDEEDYKTDYVESDDEEKEDGDFTFIDL